MARTVVVTGAASGIGRATFELLSQRGNRVIGVDIVNADVCVDLSRPEGRAQMVEEISDRTGGELDGLVVCAGLARPEPVSLAVNFFGAVATLQGLRPLLSHGADPRAAVISSVASTFPTDATIVELSLAGDETAALKACEHKGELVYSSSKLALARWVRRNAVKEEWAGAGILLNAIGPGLIQTPMTQSLIDDPMARQSMKQIMPEPLGRHGQPKEVAQLLAFLVSPENSLLVAQMIFIDGGGEAIVRGDMAW